MNIFVGNISFKAKENDLSQLFEEYGEVSSIKIIRDNLSGKSKGFGFVEMPNEEEAQNAMKELNGALLLDKELVVNEARPRTQNNNRRPFERNNNFNRNNNSGGGGGNFSRRNNY